MNNGKIESVLSISKELLTDLDKLVLPPEEGAHSITQKVIPFSIVKDTRGYIEKVANQINGCYEYGWFDACAVMMRRLLETLIIEVFERKGIADKIKNDNDDFYFLGELIDITLKEKSFNLTRITKRALDKLKLVGDQSAHSRYFNAHLPDIEKIRNDFRTVVQELIYISGLK